MDLVRRLTAGWWPDARSVFATGSGRKLPSWCAIGGEGARLPSLGHATRVFQIWAWTLLGGL